jgi:hypothetical protein
LAFRRGLAMVSLMEAEIWRRRSSSPICLRSQSGRGSRVAGASGVASMRAELAGELLEAHRAATSRIR